MDAFRRADVGLGHTRSFAAVGSMSPEQVQQPSVQKALLFDHLVGAGEQRRRRLDAERLSGVEVDDQLDFRGLLDRQIAGLLAAQNAIDIGGGATNGVYRVGPVGDQAAVSGKVRQPIYRRYVVSGRRRYDRRAMPECEPPRHDGKAASRLASKGDDGRFDFYVAANGRRDWHDLE